jgi:2-dehydro-3-deoxyphosphogluconate aldolase/(4S)-4-hydroxy-2-oxoglutarate aldolase
VIPLIQADDVAVATAIAGALAAGGMTVVEVVQRTGAAADCLEAIASAQPELIVGAGTVLSPAQADACLERGARFIVSPGLDDELVAAVQRRNIDMLPGIATPTEAQHALRLGLDTVKFFPAAVAGGTAMLGALAAVFRTLRFIPTGGISAANLGSFLQLPAVLACGGSWLTPTVAADADALARITELAREALTIARDVRDGANPA